MCGVTVKRTRQIPHKGSSQRLPTEVHGGSARRFRTKVHAGSSTNLREKNRRGTAVRNPREEPTSGIAKRTRGTSVSNLRGKNPRGTRGRNSREEPTLGITVLKLGGELLDDGPRMNAIARVI